MGNADSKEPAVGAGFILCSNDHSKLLMVQDARTEKWGFPKGHREPTDASEIHTAIRECAEETGLQESDYEILPGTMMYNSYLFWYAKLKGSYRYTSLAKGPNSEIRALQWMPVEEILRKNTLSINRYTRLWKEDMAHPSSKASQLFATHVAKRRQRNTRKQRSV